MKEHSLAECYPLVVLPELNIWRYNTLPHSRFARAIAAPSRRSIARANYDTVPTLHAKYRKCPLTCGNVLTRNVQDPEIASTDITPIWRTSWRSAHALTCGYYIGVAKSAKLVI